MHNVLRVQAGVFTKMCDQLGCSCLCEASWVAGLSHVSCVFCCLACSAVLAQAHLCAVLVVVCSLPQGQSEQGTLVLYWWLYCALQPYGDFLNLYSAGAAAATIAVIRVRATVFEAGLWVVTNCTDICRVYYLTHSAVVWGH